MSEDQIKCKTCKREIDPLAVFPGGICVDCYAKTPEANRPMTASEIAGMWGKQSLR